MKSEAKHNSPAGFFWYITMSIIKENYDSFKQRTIKWNALFRELGYDGFTDKTGDRKSTRLNSSHVRISYAVFCLKKKKTTNAHPSARRSRRHAWPPARARRPRPRARGPTPPIPAPARSTVQAAAPRECGRHHPPE